MSRGKHGYCNSIRERYMKTSKYSSINITRGTKKPYGIESFLAQSIHADWIGSPTVGINRIDINFQLQSSS